MDTQAVVDHHLAAFGAGDADKIATDYTADSVLITPDGAVNGRDAIHATFTAIFSGIFAPGTYEFTMDVMTVEGNVAYIIWHARCATMDVVFGTDTFVVRDGKIAAQTYALKVEPR